MKLITNETRKYHKEIGSCYRHRISRHIALALARIAPLYLIAGFVLYTCRYFFRALRFHIPKIIKRLQHFYNQNTT